MTQKLGPQPLRGGGNFFGGIAPIGLKFGVDTHRVNPNVPTKFEGDPTTLPKNPWEGILDHQSVGVPVRGQQTKIFGVYSNAIRPKVAELFPLKNHQKQGGRGVTFYMLHLVVHPVDTSRSGIDPTNA